MKKLWLFGTYAWQGNVKALFMYMYEYMRDQYDCYWVAEDDERADAVQAMGYPAVVLGTDEADDLFARANVYVNENFREAYPDALSDQTIILNLWHGVGLKHIELALGEDSTLASSIVRKYVRNYQLYKDQVLFLATSDAMEEHFLAEMPLDQQQIVRGGYPRNFVYRDSKLSSFDHHSIQGKDLSSFNKVFLFAPTYRFRNTNNSFKPLLPDLTALQTQLKKENQLFIIKLHPFMLKDPDYLVAKTASADYPNILFWDSEQDVYEIFDQIDCAIVDYSSVFYDLLEAGVKQFIRYIPDYDEYVADSAFIADYFEYTDGEIVKSFQDLLSALSTDIKPTPKSAELLDHFFSFDQDWQISDLISEVDHRTTRKVSLPQLHTFDIFDTLIRRKSLAPESIFYQVRDALKQSKFVDELDEYLVENYPRIRQQVEADTRDVFKKTLFERDTDKREVTLMQILQRLQNNFGLSDEVVQFLYDCETKLEISNVEPIQKRIDYLFELVKAGQTVYLISDMYLDESTVKKMLIQADKRLADLPLYLSSSLGYQKTTQKLFIHVFFDRPYHFTSWTHYGDSKWADGKMPRRLSIHTFNHDMDSFTQWEQTLIDESAEPFKAETYRVATLLRRYRWHSIYEAHMQFNEQRYYAYGYVGTVFVPYVDWAIRDAIKRGYQTLYFISRDGYYLKQIADTLIAAQGWKIKTKYIYGSRKVWRVPAFIDSVDEATFSPFGLFSQIKDFDELVKSSQLGEKELLQILPELESYRFRTNIRGQALVTLRKIFQQSQAYRQRLVEIAAERRPIVKQYLQQEINFDEKFAFVEFWGRGYTQDTHTRLMIDAAGHELDNPYYYIRNITPDHGHSKRHRFTTRSTNYTYFENVFSTTPYDSITAYEYDENGKVKPVINYAPNPFHQAITDGITDFAQDYADLKLAHPVAIDRQLADISTNYQSENPNDKYITDVFAEYNKDSTSIYGAAHAFAPAFSMAQAQKALRKPTRRKGIAYLRQYTRNIRMSSARSAAGVRQELIHLTHWDLKPITKEMPIHALTDYVQLGQLPARALLLKERNVYQSVDWSPNSKVANPLPAFSIVTVRAIDWTVNGAPRLRIDEGYILANKGGVMALKPVPTDVSQIYLNADQPVFDAPNLDSSHCTEQLLRGGRVYTVEVVEANQPNVWFLKIGDQYLLYNEAFMVPLNKAAAPLVGFLDHRVMVLHTLPTKQFNPETNFLATGEEVAVGETLPIDGIRIFGDEYYLASGDICIAQHDLNHVRKVTMQIDDYYVDWDGKQQVLALQDVHVYSQPDLQTPPAETTFAEGAITDVVALVWDEDGYPWLQTKDGYLLATRDQVSLIAPNLSEFADDLDADALGLMADIFNDDGEE